MILLLRILAPRGSLVGHGSSLIAGRILAEDELKSTDGSVCYCNLLEPGGNRREHEQAEMPINTIIVDDEKPARDELAYLLKGFRKST